MKVGVWTPKPASYNQRSVSFKNRPVGIFLVLYLNFYDEIARCNLFRSANVAHNHFKEQWLCIWILAASYKNICLISVVTSLYLTCVIYFFQIYSVNNRTGALVPLIALKKGTGCLFGAIIGYIIRYLKRGVIIESFRKTFLRIVVKVGFTITIMVLDLMTEMGFLGASAKHRNHFLTTTKAIICMIVAVLLCDPLYTVKGAIFVHGFWVCNHILLK